MLSQRILFFAAALAITLCMGGLAFAQKNATRIPRESPADIWTVRAGDIDALVQESAALRASAERLARPLADELRTARSEFARLSSLYQASRGHPTEQLTLVQQMRAMQRQMKKRVTPLKDIAEAIAGRLEELSALQNDLEETIRETAADGTGTLAAADAAGLGRYTHSLNEARKTLTLAAARLRNILAPAQSFMARFENSVTDIENSLASVWKNYYLAPSDAVPGTPAFIPALPADWFVSLKSRMAFAYPHGADAWLAAAKVFFVSALFLILLAWFGVRAVRRLPGRWRRALETAIRRSRAQIVLGLSILLAAENRSGGIYFAFVLAGSLLLIAGVAALAWRLRTAVAPLLEDKPSPLNRLYFPAAAGVLMLFSDLPVRVLEIAWFLIMAIFLAAIAALNRNHAGKAALPLLERISYSSAFWFGLASLLGTLGGFARLSILLFMLHFALANIVTMGSALMGLADILANRLFDKKDMPVRNALAEAAGVPAAWALSLLCALPWFLAVPGARYAASHALSANYTLGDASFDFTRVVLIVLLFFLFRSFVSLSKTSLEHLPDRLPSMERGVIPPLRTLTVYALWALFAIIALGMVGVNFTSLAVVAGGLSIGIGFGMQNIFNNLASGLMLIFGRSILVGDYVDIAGASGTVRAINIRSTVIETPERALVYVPNSAIMSGQLTNWTRNSRMVRRTLHIGAAYGADTALVMRLLLQAAAEQRNILQKPAPAVYLNNFGDSSLDFAMNVFIDDFDNSAAAMSALRLAVERLFAENGLVFPSPA